MSDPQAFDTLATQVLERIVRAVDDQCDPDEVEAVPSMGVVTLDFQGARRNWVVNSQSAAGQIWLAAEQRAWHFAPEGAGAELRWVAPKTGEELFETLRGLFREHLDLTLEL